MATFLAKKNQLATLHQIYMHRNESWNQLATLYMYVMYQMLPDMKRAAEYIS
jgi:hypothetical protein